MTQASEQLEARATTVSPGNAADRLGLEPSTLANWRYRGGGPLFIKVGGRVRYRLCDLAEWLDSRSRSSTSCARSGSHARTHLGQEQ